MTEKFKNTYRNKTMRLKGWDYSSSGYYFVTICTKDHINYFGDIVKEKMEINNIGKVVEQFWKEIPTHFLYIDLDEFVVMPNHIHGILIIDEDKRKNLSSCVTCYATTDRACYVPEFRRDVACYATTDISEKNDTSKRMSKISPKSGVLSSIIRSYKGACSKEINKMVKGDSFSWQNRFYEHIIRNEKSLDKIRQYITNNILQWNLDTENEINKDKDAKEYYKKIFAVT